MIKMFEQYRQLRRVPNSARWGFRGP